ncbi:hypothetical protein GXP67_06160 [Rhodocytophaga rosea]|uniref:FTP domain-containing protein n=1 Tax=Rhodocytophaga rosea TaxID=2704465 RepID=A0A6C0GF25_9BACT|nr:hypothetical protein [Rhodocytophaga rosea]QHT66270.1 hypothetical protein GXP67_06160 [Rhodocytophaga rosea]
MIHAYKLTAFLAVLLALAYHVTYSQSVPIKSSVAKGSPFYVKVDQQNSINNQSFDLIKQKIGLGTSDQLVSLQRQSDIGGISHEKLQHYFNGLKVEYGIYKIHAKNGMVEGISGELY